VHVNERCKIVYVTPLSLGLEIVRSSLLDTVWPEPEICASLIRLALGSPGILTNSAESCVPAS